MDSNSVPSLIFTTVAVLLIFFLAWFVTRLVGGRISPGGAKGRHIKILEKTAVSKDSAIFIADICGRLSVIGMTPQGMTVLRELTEQEAAEIRPDADTAAPKGFAQTLQETLDNSLPQGKVKDSVDKLFHKKDGGGTK